MAQSCLQKLGDDLAFAKPELKTFKEPSLKDVIRIKEGIVTINTTFVKSRRGTLGFKYKAWTKRKNIPYIPKGNKPLLYERGFLETLKASDFEDLGTLKAGIAEQEIIVYRGITGKEVKHQKILVTTDRKIAETHGKVKAYRVKRKYLKSGSEEKAYWRGTDELVPPPERIGEIEAIVDRKWLQALDEAAPIPVGKPKIFYHGTTAKLDKFGKGITYLSADPAEVEVFAKMGVELGERKGKVKTLQIAASPGKVKDITEVVDDVIMSGGGDLNKVIAKEVADARKQGYKYLEFSHPSSVAGADDFKATISLFPDKDLKIIPAVKKAASIPKITVRASDKVKTEFAAAGKVKKKVRTGDSNLNPEQWEMENGEKYLVKNSGAADAACERAYTDFADEIGSDIVAKTGEVGIEPGAKGVQQWVGGQPVDKVVKTAQQWVGGPFKVGEALEGVTVSASDFRTVLDGYALTAKKGNDWLVMDWLFQQQDRHFGNIMLNMGKRGAIGEPFIKNIKLIDNGMAMMGKVTSFYDQTRLAKNIKLKLDPKTIGGLKKFAKKMGWTEGTKDWSIINNNIDEYFSRYELDAGPTKGSVKGFRARFRALFDSDFTFSEKLEKRVKEVVQPTAAELKSAAEAKTIGEPWELGAEP